MIHYYINKDNLIAGTSLRKGGFSQDPFDSLNMALYVGDDTTAVLKNRQQLAQTTGFPLKQWVLPHIVHGDRILKIDQEHMGLGAFDDESRLQGIDGFYTSETSIMLGMFHADCIPLIFIDSKKPLIGIVHAGWRGSLLEITKQFIKIWIEKEGCLAQDIMVYLGPSLRKDHFEIQNDLISLIHNQHPHYNDFISTHNQKHVLDVVGINMAQLSAMEIPLANITIHPACTYQQADDYFSYRRDHKTGRHLSFVGMKP